jgi:hypothetical protein
MAKIYGATKLDPVNAPIGIVSDGVAVILPQGFTIPAGKDAAIGRNLTVGGSLSVTGTITLSGAVNTISNTTNLSTLNVSSAATFSSTIAINGSINSNVVPDSNVRNFGSLSVRWGTGFFSTVNATAITADTLSVSTSLSSSAGLSVTGTTALTGDLTCTGSALPKELKINNPADTNNTQNTALGFFAEGSFIGALTGCTTNPTAVFRYIRIGRTVILSGSPTLEATSNSGTMTITGLPAFLNPLNDKNMPHIIKDNGVLAQGKVKITSGGVITLHKDAAETAFTSSGTKGIVGLSCYYIID